MSALAPISLANSMRAQTASDLEVTLVKFLGKLFDSSRLDNPTVNLGQPDEVSYDPKERARALSYKVPPKIVRGRIPRTVTGDIALDKLPDYPAVIVQAIGGKVMNTPAEHACEIVQTRLLFVTYDENPDSQGHQDVLNMVAAATIALTGFGQAALDQAYPIVFPIEWTLMEADCFPHFLGELTCSWELPSARPLIDDYYGRAFSIPIPAEHVELRGSAV